LLKKKKQPNPIDGDNALMPICRHLDWDSDFWGFPVGRLEASLLRESEAENVLEWCQANEIRCLYFAANGSNAETLKRAHEAGFQFVDIRVDLECDAARVIDSSLSENSPVRPVTEADLESLKAIARSAHQDTRFFKDLNFERSKCAKLYEKWIERDFEFAQVLGFFPGDRAVAGGYVTLAKESVDARLGLIALAESLRGRGGGRMLLDAAMSAAVELGAKKIRVVTQGTNVAALKLYEKAGFRVCDVKIWFHRWFPACKI
jgi:dTDP-4-amino-4,6-dideoxy-D-galactose acyltransferase